MPLARLSRMTNLYKPCRIITEQIVNDKTLWYFEDIQTGLGELENRNLGPLGIGASSWDLEGLPEP